MLLFATYITRLPAVNPKYFDLGFVWFRLWSGRSIRHAVVALSLSIYFSGFVSPFQPLPITGRLTLFTPESHRVLFPSDFLILLYTPHNRFGF